MARKFVLLECSGCRRVLFLTNLFWCLGSRWQLLFMWPFQIGPQMFLNWFLGLRFCFSGPMMHGLRMSSPADLSFALFAKSGPRGSRGADARGDVMEKWHDPQMVLRVFSGCRFDLSTTGISLIRSVPESSWIFACLLLVDHLTHSWSCQSRTEIS